uniref:Uncharacterized protein n=1 Tax=Arundo donax TaxID=35708 RepID=A0A0A9EK80_ARUDO
MSLNLRDRAVKDFNTDPEVVWSCLFFHALFTVSRH